MKVQLCILSHRGSKEKNPAGSQYFIGLIWEPIQSTRRFNPPFTDHSQRPLHGTYVHLSKFPKEAAKRVGEKCNIYAKGIAIYIYLLTLTNMYFTFLAIISPPPFYSLCRIFFLEY